MLVQRYNHTYPKMQKLFCACYRTLLQHTRSSPGCSIQISTRSVIRLIKNMSCHMSSLLQDPEKRAKAEQMFSKLKHAHEVLTDPHKRAKYDCLGEKGIAEQAWEVVARVKTPQEIREEYESIAQARAERRRQQLTNPTSSVSMTVKYYMLMNIPFILVLIIR